MGVGLADQMTFSCEASNTDHKQRSNVLYSHAMILKL